MLKCCNNVGEKQYSQSRTCFFSLCWLFNYIEVGRACIYGALAECEPVQLKRLQANTQSHKAVPLGPRHPSTRLLMTAVRLPWREGPAASHWHMPGKSSWGWCATETRFQRKLVRGGARMWEKKTPRLTPAVPFENLSATFPSNQPAGLRSALSRPLGPSCPSRLWEWCPPPGDARHGMRGCWGAEMQGESMEGQRWVRLTSRPQRSNMSHLSWPLGQVF